MCHSSASPPITTMHSIPTFGRGAVLLHALWLDVWVDGGRAAARIMFAHFIDTGNSLVVSCELRILHAGLLEYALRKGPSNRKSSSRCVVESPCQSGPEACGVQRLSSSVLGLQLPAIPGKNSEALERLPLFVPMTSRKRASRNGVQT